jgi:hypothetical protein
VVFLKGSLVVLQITKRKKQIYSVYYILAIRNHNFLALSSKTELPYKHTFYTTEQGRQLNVTKVLLWCTVVFFRERALARISLRRRKASTPRPWSHPRRWPSHLEKQKKITMSLDHVCDQRWLRKKGAENGSEH